MGSTFLKLVFKLQGLSKRLLFYLHISLHLLIGYPKEVLAGTSVAETTCAEMDVVQTGHSVYLRTIEEHSYSLG